MSHGDLLKSVLGGVGTLLFNGPPQPKPPPTMPDPNDPAMLLAQKQKIAMQTATRGGRASTILSAPSNDYSSTTMG